MQTTSMVGAGQMLSELVVDDRMNTCEVCGNTYDKCFVVQMKGEAHIFDSFECAMHMLAPHCAHCECHILGHGMETDGLMYCCAHCARQHGITEMEDRVEYAEPAG